LGRKIAGKIGTVMSEDKRQTKRHQMFKVCRYTIEGREYADLSTNISERGIFIKNFSPPNIGTRVTLTVSLPGEWGGFPMQLEGRVAWAENGEDPHKRGMGIEFISVKADSLPIIEYFVREVYHQEDLKEPQLKVTSQGSESDSFEYELDIDVEDPV
jgi:uncharacterized protein (TIGR02266 family)